MKLGKRLLVFGLLASLVLAAPVIQTWATNPPPALPEIVGPEYWGVVVIDCAVRVITLRLKRVDDCNIDTQALTQYYGVAICDTEITEETILYQWFPGTVFGQTANPIVTKVKNLKKETFPSGDVYSADVQIRFCNNCL